MTYLIVKFDEKLSGVMLYMNNAPIQALKPVNTVSKKPMIIKTTNGANHISSKTRVQF